MVDTAYLSFVSIVSSRMRDLLDLADAHPDAECYRVGGAAIEYRDRKAEAPPPRSVCWTCRRRPLKGFERFPWTVTGRAGFAGLRLLVSTAEDRDRPAERRIMIMLGADRLAAARAAGMSLQEQARAILLALSGDQRCELLTTTPDLPDVKVSRLDLAVDHWYQGRTDRIWHVEDLQRFAVARSASRGQAQTEDAWLCDPDGYVAGGKGGFTLYIGRRGTKARFVRIYDKTKEASDGKLRWLISTWTPYGWDGERVFRVEYEHGSEWLKRAGIGTLDLLTDRRLALLWARNTNEVRHTVGGNRLRKRCETSPQWGAIQRAALVKHQEHEWSPYEADPQRDASMLMQQSAGCLLTAIDTAFSEIAGADFEPATNPDIESHIDVAMRELSSIVAVKAASRYHQA
jgi:hypothetical protein